jgi:hypothetical protein
MRLRFAFALLGLALPLAAVAQLPLGPGAQRPPWAKPAEPPSAGAAEDADAQPTLGDDQDTIDAGLKWLALIDEGHADAAWDVASAHLKSVVSRDRWVKGMSDFRKPFGKIASRKAVKFGRAHSMPDAPDGDYAIIQYETTFANGKRATEQLVWVLEGENSWRVSGYYIR